MKKRVLSDKELADLLKVPTTVAQAHAILERNIRLLDALENGRDYDGKIGCPHCNWVSNWDVQLVRGINIQRERTTKSVLMQNLVA